MSDGEKKTVIIGAGIIGIACAHYLAADGRKVVVLDRGRIAEGCSYGNCGHILPSHILPLNSPGAIKDALKSLFDRDATFLVKPQLSLSFANWFVQFARHCTRRRMIEGAAHLKQLLDSSFCKYETLMTEGDIDCGWRQAGMAYLFHSKSAFDDYSRTDELLRDRFGVAARSIQGGELADFDPAIRSGLAGAFFYAGDALLRPDRLGAAWAQRLREQGVEFVEHCNAVRLEKEGARIRSVITDARAYEADSVVIAAGAFSPQFAAGLECDIPVLPGKGYSLTFRRPETCPKSSYFLPERNIAMTPFADGFRVGSMMEFVGFDESLSQKRVMQLKAGADAYFREPLDEPEEAWFGWRPMTWDSLPIIGRAPKLKNAVIATGHAMMGMMMAPGTGRLVADIVGEYTPHIPAAPYSPARFAN